MTTTTTILMGIATASAIGYLALSPKAPMKVPLRQLHTELMKHPPRNPWPGHLLRAIFWVALMFMFASMARATPAYAPTPLGRNPTEINAKFPGLIEANLSTTRFQPVFAVLTNREVVDLYEVYKKAKGNVTFLDSRVATYGGSRDKQRWAQAKAGTLPVTPPQDGIPGGGTKSILIGLGGMSTTSISAPPPQWLDFTMKEIYLDLRTAPLGALSVRSALFGTANAVAMAIAAGWGIGYYGAGPAVRWAIVRYAPDLDNAIGAAVSITVETLDDALTPDAQEQATVDLANEFYYNQGGNASKPGDYKLGGAYSAAWGYYNWFPGGITAWSGLRGTVTVEPCEDDDGKICGK